MTNPIKFLFEKIRFISFDTQILEACDWDEERAEFVKEELQKTLLGLQQGIDAGGNFSSSDLKDNLSLSLSEKEVDACLCIIENCMINYSDFGESSYEN